MGHPSDPSLKSLCGSPHTSPPHSFSVSLTLLHSFYLSHPLTLSQQAIRLPGLSSHFSPPPLSLNHSLTLSLSLSVSLSPSLTFPLSGQLAMGPTLAHRWRLYNWAVKSLLNLVQEGQLHHLLHHCKQGQRSTHTSLLSDLQ